MDFSKIDKLGIKERKVLYLFAFLGNNTFFGSNVGIERELLLTLKEFNQAVASLKKAKLLRDDFYGSYYYSRNNIVHSFRVPALIHMHNNEPGVERALRKLFAARTEEIGFMDAILYAACGASKPKRVSLDSPYSYLQSCLLEPWLYKLLDLLRDEDHYHYLSSVIETFVISDTVLLPDALEKLFLTEKKDEEFLGLLADLKAYYLYCFKGEFNIDPLPSPNRPYQLIMHAIQQCVRGNYQEAYTLFASAQKVMNKTQDIKNVFFSVMGQYYYTLVCEHLGTVTSKNKISQFLRKKDLDSLVYFMPSLALGKAFCSSTHTPDIISIENLVNLYVNGLPARNFSFLAWFFTKYFGLSSGKVGYSTALPNCRILQFEAMKFLKLSDQISEDLKNLYGPFPALTSIRRKEKWEWAIDDILRSVDEQNASSEKQAAATQERILYTIQPRSTTLEPVLQTMLKSGKWSKPKTVGKRKFEDMQISCMDDTDRAIASLMTKLNPYQGYPQYPSISDTLHMFIGSDRLYQLLPDGSLGERIEVEEIKPWVKLVKKGDKIAIDSCVKLKEVPFGFNGGSIVRKVDNKHYNVMRISQSQMDIITKLLNLGEFPAHAESQVQQFLTRLEEVIEVKSPLLDSNAIPNVDGGSMLVIKAKPAPAMSYEISIFAHPTPQGSVYVTPGLGRGIVYDTVDGKNVRVKRNLEAEAQALRDFVDFLDGEGIEFPDDTQGVVSVEQLLSIMDFVRESDGAIAVEWPEGKKLTLKQANSSSSWNVGIKSDNGWFDIEGDVRIDSETVFTMAQFLDLVGQSKGRFIRLNDQDFIEIDKKLRKQLERIESLAVKNRNKLQISSFNAALLDEKALDGEVKFKFDSQLLELQKRIKDSEEYNPPVPPALNATLRPYQLEGYQWMARLASWGAGACLADDMGLGKTVQTIAFLLLKASEGPALVVAPASVVPNWCNELEKFAPSLRVSVLNKAESRTKTIEDAAPYDVILTTYGLLNTEEENLAKKKFATVCLDEAHTIKNRETKMSHAAMQLQASYRIILTGTPIQNHLGELWNLFRFINPGLLGSFDTFRNKYVNPITQDNDKDRRKALQRIIKPFMLRRTKTEVIDDLPEKNEIILPVELADDELAMYEAMRLKTVEALEKADKVDVNTLAEITKLRRAACSMELVDSSWKGSASKVQSFLDLVQDFKGDNNRMLVFSQFTSFFDIVRRALDAAGEPYLYLDGSTTMKQREKLVEEFRSGSCPLFLISLKAGGLGLNLPEANYVVHLDPWWNPAIEQQATDRAYRIGQKRDVTVYHLVAKNTIEEKIRRLHRTKRDLADSLLEGTGVAGQLTVKDIIELVSNN